MPTDSNPPLRAMTFNIRFATADDGPNHWKHRQNAVIAAIADFDPDVLGTQETLLVQRDFIVERLPHYAAVGVGRDDGKDKGEMTATFYRTDRFDLLASGHFWLSETPAVPGSVGWDAVLTRMATWLKLRDRRAPESKPIVVINAHFDHVGKVAQKESAKLLRTQAVSLAEGCRVIIMGDFNSTQDEPPYAELAGRRLGDRTLLDAFRTAHPERSENELSFTGFNADATKGSAIDFIFVTDDFKVEAAEIHRIKPDGRLPSDHFPITATLR